MSDYLEERHNILTRMADLSKRINWTRSQIECDTKDINKLQEDIVRNQKVIDDGEVELLYLMDQLKQEFQE
ncbi:MAG: hypothetical protein RBT15_04810 [Gudongella sp.]|jgi:peptidoglycan hydrolase CwlO-like protein|nr:hypothetical protein [Gudongella sp.]